MHRTTWKGGIPAAFINRTRSCYSGMMERLRKAQPFIIAALSFSAAILLLYLTPLRYLLVEPVIEDVSAGEIYGLMQAEPDRYLFIDVRPRDVYEKKHAAGSINIELHRLYFERERLPKRGKEIVLICSGGVASGVAYGYLEHYGFLNLKRVDGGIESWEEAGLPLAPGSR